MDSSPYCKKHIIYWISFLTLHLNIYIKREWICISNLATYNWTCKCITWHLKRKGNRGTNNTISIFSGHNFGLFLSPLREQSRNYNSNICHLNFIKRKEKRNSCTTTTTLYVELVWPVVSINLFFKPCIFISSQKLVPIATSLI